MNDYDIDPAALKSENPEERVLTQLLVDWASDAIKLSGMLQQVPKHFVETRSGRVARETYGKLWADAEAKFSTATPRSLALIFARLAAIQGYIRGLQDYVAETESQQEFTRAMFVVMQRLNACIRTKFEGLED